MDPEEELVDDPDEDLLHDEEYEEEPDAEEKNEFMSVSAIHLSTIVKSSTGLKATSFNNDMRSNFKLEKADGDCSKIWEPHINALSMKNNSVEDLMNNIKSAKLESCSSMDKKEVNKTTTNTPIVTSKLGSGIRFSSRNKLNSSKVSSITEDEEEETAAFDAAKKYHCEICGLKLSSRVTRKHHIITQHIQEKNFKCEECGKSFFIAKSLRNHQLVHKVVKDHQCPICQKQIAHKSSLEVHIKRVHNTSREKLLPCPICDKKMRDKHSLKCHLSAVHTDKTIKCLEEGCSKMFPNESYMRSHYRTHLDEKPHECSVCGQRFKTKSYMEKHQRSHSGLRPHKCEDCGRSYLTVSHLNAHAKVHTGERPYQCSECGKCFRLKRHLIYHTNLHSGNKPFECPDCGYKTGFKSNWYAHRKRHAGSKTFECYLCQKNFFDRQSLLKHLESHQRRTEKEERNKRRLLELSSKKPSKVALFTVEEDGAILKEDAPAANQQPCIFLDGWEDFEEPVGQLLQLVSVEGKPLSNVVIVPNSDVGPQATLVQDGGVYVSLDVNSTPVLDTAVSEFTEMDTITSRAVHVSDQSLASTTLPEDNPEDSLGVVVVDQSFPIQDPGMGGLPVHIITGQSSSRGEEEAFCVQVPPVEDVPVSVGCDQCSNTLVLLEDLSEHLQTFHGLEVDGCVK